MGRMTIRGNTQIIAGTVSGTELNASVAGDGLTGAGGSALAVGSGAGLAVTADAVAIDLTSTITKTSGVWTYPVDTLQITGTPDSANDAVNKTYVDSIASGIAWKDPVDVINLIGNASVATINGLSPAAGDAYVVTDADTITSGSISTAIGDLVEYNGTIWVRLKDGAGGFVADGVRAGLSTATALVSPYTDATDDGKIVAFDGTSLTGVATGDAVDGNAVLTQDEAHVGYNDNLGYVFEGTVPTGSWVQFTGAGTVNAGAGLTKSGSTLNVGAGDGIDVAADSVSVDVTDIIDTAAGLTETTNNIQINLKTSGGLKFDTNQVAVEPTDFAGTGLEDDGSDNLRLASQGNGILGGAGSTLSVNPDTSSTTTTEANAIAVGANGVSVKVDDSTIEGSAQGAASTETLRVKADGIDNTHINWGSTGNQVDADDLPTGTNWEGTATDVDAALEELRDGQTAAYSFRTMNCPSGTDPVAEAADDTLNWAAGSGISITGDSSTDTITIANTGEATALTASLGVERSTNDFRLDLLASGGLKLTGNEVGVEPADFAGTGLEDSSDTLRIAAAAAGDGLTGGGGSALSVDEVAGEAPTNKDNSEYSLANTPVAASVKVYVNGLRQYLGSGNDYTLTGTSVTFTSANDASDVVLVDYLK